MIKNVGFGAGVCKADRSAFEHPESHVTAPALSHNNPLYDSALCKSEPWQAADDDSTCHLWDTNTEFWALGFDLIWPWLL